MVNQPRKPPVDLPGAVERGGAGCPTSYTVFNELIYSAIDRPEAQDLLREAARSMPNVPGADMLVRLTNRSALADEPAIKGALGYRMQEQWDATDLHFRSLNLKQKLAGAKLRMVPTVGMAPDGSEVRGTEAALDVIKKGEASAKPVPLGTVFEDPDLYDLTPTLREAIDEGHQLIDDLAREYEDNLGEQLMNRLTLGGKQPMLGAEFTPVNPSIRTRVKYWPRFIRNEKGQVEVAFRQGAQPAPTLQRQFEDLAQGLEAGVNYDMDGYKEVLAYGSSLRKASRDKNLARYLEENGVTRKLKEGERPSAKEQWGSTLNPRELADVAIPTQALTEMQKILAPMGRTAQAIQKVSGAISGIPKALLAGVLDNGVGFLQMQMIPFLPTRPVRPGIVGFAGAVLSPQQRVEATRIWAGAMSQTFQTLFTGPGAWEKYVVEHPRTQLASRYGLDLSLSSVPEQLSAAPLLQQGLQKIPVAGRPAAALVERVQQTFSTGLAVGRFGVFDVLSSIAKQAGADTPSEMYRIARYADSFVGTTNTARMGQSALQQAIETNWIAFAPKYTRSIFGVASYAAGKGFTPQQARIALANTLFWGHATAFTFASAAYMATGMNPDEAAEKALNAINPTAGKEYLSIQIGDHWYGFGGAGRAALAALGGMTGLSDTNNDGVNDWANVPLNATAVYKNPIVQQMFSYWRGRSAPLSSSVVDFAAHEDYIGNRVNIEEMVSDPMAFADFARGKFLPLTLDAFLSTHGSDWRTRVAATTAAAAGLRESPETAGEFLRRQRERVTLERFPDLQGYEDLKWDTPARAEINDDPRVQGAFKRISERQAQQNLTPEEQASSRYYDRADEIREQYHAEQQSDDDTLMTGKMSPVEWRERWSNRAIAQHAELSSAQKTLEVEFPEKEDAPDGTPDAVLNAYFAIKPEDYTDPATKEINWDEFFSDREQALLQLPASDRPRVEAYIQRNLTDIQREFRKDNKAIENVGWFDLRHTAWDKVRTPTDPLSLKDLERDAADQLAQRGVSATPEDARRVVDKLLDQRLAQTQARALGIDVEELDRMSRAGQTSKTSVMKVKEAFREANPDLEATLARWGYISCVRSLEAVRQVDAAVKSGLPVFRQVRLCDDVAKALSRQQE